MDCCRTIKPKEPMKGRVPLIDSRNWTYFIRYEESSRPARMGQTFGFWNHSNENGARQIDRTLLFKSINHIQDKKTRGGKAVVSSFC
jgi:hypothetical protein